MATLLSIDGQKAAHKTETTVLDPPSPHQAEVPPDERLSDLAIRLSYAKALNMADHAFLAALLVAGRPWPPTLFPQARLDGIGEVRLLGPFPLGGLLVATEWVWRALERHHEHVLGGAIREALAGRSLAEPPDRDGVVMLNNGIGLWGTP